MKFMIGMAELKAGFTQATRNKMQTWMNGRCRWQEPKFWGHWIASSPLIQTKYLQHRKIKQLEIKLTNRSNMTRIM